MAVSTRRRRRGAGHALSCARRLDSSSARTSVRVDEDARLSRDAGRVISSGAGSGDGRRRDRDARGARRACARRCARALGRALLPDAGLEHPGDLALEPADVTDLLVRFKSEVGAVGGAIHEASTPRGYRRQSSSTRLGANDAREVLAWDDDRLPVRGLHAALARAGFVIRSQANGDFDSRERQAALASASVGLTGAAAGLAETGSIVVVSGRGQSRLASLLPPVHVAVLKKSAVVYSLAVLLRNEPALATSGANFVCITGPSRTADIEHILARGVHGPKEIHVVLVDYVAALCLFGDFRDEVGHACARGELHLVRRLRRGSEECRRARVPLATRRGFRSRASRQARSSCRPASCRRRSS